MYDLWNYWFFHQKSLFFEQMQLRPTISTWCYDLRQKCLQSQVTTKSWAIRWGMSELAIQTYTCTFWTKRGIFGKKLHFARVFWLFGLPNFIHWPCNAQIWIPHEILHWHSAPQVTSTLKEMSLGHGKEILAELRFSMLLGWQFVEPAH